MSTAPCSVPFGTNNLSQFELCKQIYTSGFLGRFKLSPTTKLVLFALSNHYNPNKKDMFPSQDYLSKQLGISVKSVQRAVSELAKAGLCMYDTKRVNHYTFTPLFFKNIELREESKRSSDIVTDSVSLCSDKVSCDDGQNVSGEGVKLSYKQIKEQKKEQRPQSGNFQKNQNKWKSSGRKNCSGFYNKDYYSNSYDKQKSNHRSLEATRAIIKQSSDIDKKSPMDDYETAIKWLEQLDSASLRQTFIAQRVAKVKTKWKIA